MHVERLPWLRAACGVALIFYGTHHALNGTADALQEKLVARFWATQRKYQEREKVLC